MAHIAQDYLAIQGSAVVSECCFSSGGLTGTNCRNKLLPQTFEALQLLKNAYKCGEVNALSDILEKEGIVEANDITALDIFGR